MTAFHADNPTVGLESKQPYDRSLFLGAVSPAQVWRWAECARVRQGPLATLPTRSDERQDAHRASLFPNRYGGCRTPAMNADAPLPIVLVHGLIGSLDEPALVAPLHPHPVLAVPLLGYGVNAGIDPAAITLPAQAEHVASVLRAQFNAGPVHLVGHSVGGVVAALLAHQHPELVAALVSVEGNFTLKDAFWSASVGRMSQADADAMLDGFRADPAAWLARSGIEPTPDHVAVAARWLANQPASTLCAMGRSVVETTGVASYEELLRVVFARMPVHLVAGERSRAGWDVPGWAEQQAASSNVVPATGHMMMLEDPDGFGYVVLRAIGRADTAV